MPKTKYIKKRGKRPIRRRRKIPRPMFRNTFSNGFPMKLYAKLTFSNHNNISSLTTAVGKHVLNLNSMFLPDITGDSSKQPRYFDQLAAETLYDVYLVTKVDYVVTFVNKGSDDCLVQLKLGNVNTDIPATANFLWQFGETKYCRNKILTAVNTTKSKFTMKGSTTIWPLIADSKLNLLADRGSYQGKFDSSPAVLAKMFLSCSDDPEGAGGSDVDIYYTFKFHCTFSNLALDVLIS